MRLNFMRFIFYGFYLTSNAGYKVSIEARQPTDSD